MENYKKKKGTEEKKPKKKGEKKGNKKEGGDATISSHSEGEEKPLCPLIQTKEGEKSVIQKKLINKMLLDKRNCRATDKNREQTSIKDLPLK